MIDHAPEHPDPGTTQACPQASDLIRFALADTTLPDDTARAVAAHLEQCDDCRRRSEAMKAELPPEGESEAKLDDELVAALIGGYDAWKRQQAATRPPQQRKWFLQLPHALTIAAVSLAAVCAYFAFTGRNADPRSPLAERQSPEVAEELRALREQVGRLQSEVKTFARLSIDESTIIQAETLRVANNRDQWQAVLARWSPETSGSAEPPGDAMREWAGRIAFRAGSEYFYLGQLDLAGRLFARAYHLGVDSPELLMAMANCAKQRGDWGPAVRWSQELCHRESFSRTKRAQAANLLAYCLYQQAIQAEGERRTRLLAEAERAVELAVELAGEEGYAKVQVQAALILQQENKTAEARRALEDGKEIARRKLQRHRDPRLYFTLAVLNARLGDVDAAVDALQQAVALENRDTPVSFLFWAKTEPAFAALPAEQRQRLQQVAEKGKFIAAEAPLAITIDGLLWDEPFAEEAVRSRANAESDL